MRKLLSAIAFVLAAGPAAAADSFQGALQAAAPAQPALYSFADIYRLTVSGAPLSGFPASAGADSAIRVAVSQAAPAPELQFSVVSIAGPQRWVLLLAGLAAALWVARRRLAYSL
jgi:hypothetical protein